MALIKDAQARSIARDAVVLDLGDLRKQGDAVVAQARARADQVLAGANADRERLIADAAEVGSAEGRARGLGEGREQGFAEGTAAAIEEIRPRLEALERAWSEALVAFASEREEMVRAAERDVIRLAATIAERVIKRSVQLDPSVVVDQVRAVLEIVVRPSALAIAVHPTDRALVERALPGLMNAFPAVLHAEVCGDERLEPGSCVARTRAACEGADRDGAAASAGGVGGEVDASIGVQLGRIVESLLPGPSRATTSL